MKMPYLFGICIRYWVIRLAFVIRISSFSEFVFIRVHISRRNFSKGGFVINT
jgi:hypothetical protein